MAAGFQIAGFLLTIGGIAAWSWPAACVVAGVTLFVAGGVEQARRASK